MSSKSIVGETLGLIYPEVKFLYSCEPINPDKLSTSKTQWWDNHRIDIPTQKGKGKKRMRSQI